MAALLTAERHCVKCGTDRPLVEFSKDSTRKDGLSLHCTPCRSAAGKAYYEKNKARITAQRSEHRRAHPDQYRARRAKYYAENRDKHRATCDRWEAANRDRVRETERAYRAAHPEHDRVKIQRHRAKLAGAPGRGVTEADMRDLLSGTTGLCEYCGKPKKLATDHIDPMEHGGAHEPENLAAACRECNSSKGTLKLIVWLARRAA